MLEPDFDSYLRLLTRLMAIDANERQAIIHELRDHMRARYRQLLADGFTPDEAKATVLEDLGDAANVAQAFNRVNQRHRRVKRALLSGIGLAAGLALIWLVPWFHTVKLAGLPWPSHEPAQVQVGPVTDQTISRQSEIVHANKEKPMRQTAMLTSTMALFMGSVITQQANSQSVPTIISHQGVVTVDGARYTGTGQFKFALVDPDTSSVVWSNDGTAGQPTAAVNLTVTDGVYSVGLGDTSAGLAALSPSLFADDNLVLRIWFNDGANGWQTLAPDHQLSSVPYAMTAESVSDAAITTDKLADGAVTADKLAPGAGGAWDKNGNDLSYTAGKVGVGTATPAAALDIYATTGDIFQAAGPNSAPNYDSWEQVTGSAGWPTRGEFTATVHDGKMWVMGGGPDGQWKNDVWYSTDGLTWTRATNSANWSQRRAMISLSYDSKLWIMGGWDGTSQADVWSSSDGISWTRATAAAAWPSRRYFQGVVYDNKMWVMGGYNGTEFSDVWYSTNGATWYQATASAAWGTRSVHSATIHDGKMWVLGGRDSTDMNDVWYSTNGANWLLATAAADWPARNMLASTSYDGKIWVYGGHSGTTYFNDVWYSSDGQTWTQASAQAGWSERSQLIGLTFGDTIWALGGIDGSSFFNDVWSISETSRPINIKLTANGTLAVGTDTPDENYVIDANGGIKCQSVTQISTRSAKKDIEPIKANEYETILTKLTSTELYRYRYNHDTQDKPKRWGFIVEESPQELISVDKAGIDMNQTLACLVAAIKAQQTNAQKQNDVIQAQQSRIEKLEKQIQQIQNP